MPSLRAIRRRIQSVKNIQQITRAMYMIATTKLRRAQAEVKSTRPYAKALDETIARLVLRIPREEHPLLRQREEKKIELVLFTSDRGLCGAFNENLIRRAEQFITENSGEKEISLVLIGKKATDYFSKRPVKIVQKYFNPEREVGFEKARTIADEIIKRFLSGDTDAVYMIYSVFQSPLIHRPTLSQLLPFQPKEGLELIAVEYRYEPDEMTILNELLPRQIRMQVFQAMLETRASEMGARMTAMDLATQNAGEMIEKLTLQMNRARQEAITKELLDIITGAEALKK